jgi:hypothetical protein
MSTWRLSNSTLPFTRWFSSEHRSARLIAVAAAVLAALAIWVVAELALGIDVRAPAFDGSGETLPIGARDVVLSSALLSFAGWGLLAILERLTARGRRAWLVIASVALVLSLATPMVGTGITMTNRIVLLLMHVVVGGVLISGLYRASQDGRS